MLQLARVAGRGACYYLDDLGDELGRVAPGHDGDAGRWIGRGAVGLRLSGPVDGSALEALLGGRNPRTGRALVATSRRSVAGFDLTFAAPKSVSLLLALSDPATADHVLAAHREAVAAAVEHLERRALSVRRGTGEDREAVPASGLVGASFTHCLSRAGDPHLHTHVVAANLAHGADGRWSAIDSRGPFAHARAVGALYDAHLRAELTDRLGTAWSWQPSRGWDVDGSDPLLIAAFSGRAAEIRQALSAYGARSGRARHVAWASTREAKDRSTGALDLASDWSRRASIAAGWRFPLPTGRGPRAEHIDEHRFATTIAGCPQSGVCRRDVVAAWADALATGARADDVERSVEHWAPGRDGPVGVAEARRAPASCVPAPHLLRALGARPAGPDGQPIWRRAADAIDLYRARWGLGRDPSPLGSDRERLSGLSDGRLADHLEAARAVREALVLLGHGARAGLERGGPAFERA